jgi:endo-1,4-beta-xylanase
MKKILTSILAFGLLVGIAQQATASGTSGFNNGFYYFTYYTGNGSTTINPNGGNYSANWTAGLSDSLAGVGWNPGSIRNIGYNYGFIAGSWNTGGAYGWAPYPQVEWYISDFGHHSGTFIGTVNSDGGTYNVYKGTQGGGPQYKSSRNTSQSQGQNHTITMANHVNYWKAHIGSFGTIRETVIMVESFTGGSGSCNGTCW